MNETSTSYLNNYSCLLPGYFLNGNVGEHHKYVLAG